MSAQYVMFCAGYVRMGTAFDNGNLTQHLSHLLGKCSNFILLILRQVLTKLSRETTNLDPPALSSWPAKITDLHTRPRPVMLRM